MPTTSDKRTVKPMDPPEPKGSGGAKASGARDGGGGERPPRRSGRPTNYDKLEASLTELFTSLALGQASLAMLTEDPRHEVAAEITVASAPKLAEAWTELARQDPRVFKVLQRLTTGSAWGGVIMTTGGYLLAQAQVYGMIPPMFAPPAGMAAGDPTDPRHTAPEPVPPVPPVPDNGADGKDPRNSAPDGGVSRDPAQNPAELQRRQVEQRRQARGS